ncbi:ubiquinone biosynthesis protein COQ4 [Sphingomonas koreensis]|jgi:ubiquinone biosynthesis protein COQ4|nr:ubiquinone biosynthesis protein COQ4 [Sphingomonas koreensis]PJI88148.1 ubiquinone biosynthesis protein COQ4 [Sphingomonas koreensis]
MATQAQMQPSSTQAPVSQAPTPRPPASQPIDWGKPRKREWGTALRALIKLLGNADDTVQVFRIMRALNGDTVQKNYRRLLSTAQGGRLAYHRVELSQRFSDRTWIDSLPEGSVGAAYRAFLDRTGYSAQGLADVSYEDAEIERDVEHPHAWFGRRERDIHDIWHILTGYQADEPLGEACLVAFSYSQTGGLGWAFIAAGAALKSLKITGKRTFTKAVLEGRRHGKRAKWLSNEDYEALMYEPLDAARRRLNIGDPKLYRQAQAELEAAGLVGL